MAIALDEVVQAYFADNQADRTLSFLLLPMISQRSTISCLQSV